jgi:hypothetical protein
MQWGAHFVSKGEDAVQSKIKLPTMTLNVGGSQVIVRLVPIPVNPSQVRYVNEKYLVGDVRLYGTDEVPRKPVTGFRVQVQWGNGAPWFGKKAPIFISAMPAFAQHSKSDEQAAVLITVGDNAKDLLITVGGGDAAGSFTWWGVYSRFGLGSSFSEGPI